MSETKTMTKWKVWLTLEREEGDGEHFENENEDLVGTFMLREDAVSFFNDLQGHAVVRVQTGELVVEALRKSGVDASWEYPGFVSVELSDGSTWAFGTANATWTGDLTDKSSYSVKGIELTDEDGPIDSASTDVEAIREAILDALNEHNQAAGTSTKQC